MKHNQDSATHHVSPKHPRWRLTTLFVCVLFILLGLFRVTRQNGPDSTIAFTDATNAETSKETAEVENRRWFYRHAGVAPTPAAEEIVATKLAQFTRSRRELARLMTGRKGVGVPDDVERFFDALESGNWTEIESHFVALSKKSRQYQNSTSPDSPSLDPVWCAVLDAYGAAEQVHEWPAQKLLDYGNSILASLRPGMVYVGGTDNGRWIPGLLNETSGGDPHVIITQNALADTRYAEYINTLYGDRLATLTEEDSKHAFQDYLADAQRRLEHDQQFPDEPKQVRPGEDVKIVDGKIQVGGQVAVMAINEKLLQQLMAKNPELGFAVQESSPLRGTYGDALPLGPVMELGARDEQNTFTPERAAQSLDYWWNIAQQMSSDPEAVGSPSVLKSYSHDTVSAANLLTAHNFTAEAEQAYRLATQLWPGNPESTAGLADLLLRGGREAEARQLVGDFSQKYPDQRKDLERLSAAARIIDLAPSAP